MKTKLIELVSTFILVGLLQQSETKKKKGDKETFSIFRVLEGVPRVFLLAWLERAGESPLGKLVFRVMEEIY